MTEQDYIKVTNITALHTAKDALTEVMSGEQYEIDEALLEQAHYAVSVMLKSSRGSIVITENKS